MQIGDKDIWQFGNEYINVNTGEPATQEEISIFEDSITKQKVIAAEEKEIRLQREKEWHEKYDNLIRDFFEYEEMGYEEEEIKVILKSYDDDRLAYALATQMFDLTSGFNYFQEQHPDDWEGQLDQVCLEVKQSFPDHWEQALENFKNGWHDT